MGFSGMMGEQEAGLNQQSQDFCLEQHVAKDHILRHIDSLLDFSDIKAHLKDYYSHTGRPSVDPELMVRMLIIGYCYGIRSERRLCEEIHYNLAYRWFCRLGLQGDTPNHSTTVEKILPMSKKMMNMNACKIIDCTQQAGFTTIHWNIGIETLSVELVQINQCAALVKHLTNHYHAVFMSLLEM